MKYLITEGKIKNVISDYIKSKYPVYEVKFDKIGVWLAHDDKRIERNVIKVIIDNSNKQFNYNQLRLMREGMWDDLNNFFSLKLEDYGSEWDLETTQITEVPLSYK